MGKHSKPSTHSATGPLVAVAIATTGAFASVPLAQGVAQADTSGPPGGWDAVIHCESGGRVDAVNRASTASGALQFLDSTWRGLGGLVFGQRAKDATLEQQEEIANRAYAQSGLTPWESSRHCWSGRIGRTTSRMARSVGLSLPRRTRGRHVLVVPRRPVLTTKHGTYVVRAGDSLSSIAAAHGHTWEQLFVANRATIRNPALIHTGVTISLP